MYSKALKNRRAISPVIATIILIAVALSLGVAIAFWSSGLTSSFSKFEKLQVSTHYAVTTQVTTSSCYTAAVCWQINLGGNNAGSSDSTIIKVLVNGVPYIPSSSYPLKYTVTSTKGSSGGTVRGSSYSIKVPAGYSFTINIYLSNVANPVAGKTFFSGQNVQITLVTAAGNSYPSTVQLP